MRRLLPAAAALLAATIAALATNTVFFTSIGDQVFPFSPPTSAGLNGTIGNVGDAGMAPVNGNLAFTKAVPSTGFSLTFGNFQHEIVLAPTGTLAAGYVTFAPNPPEGTRQCVFSTQIITAFYPTANAGQTVNNAATAMTANGRICYTYSLANTTWDRSQ